MKQVLLLALIAVTCGCEGAMPPPRTAEGSRVVPASGTHVELENNDRGILVVAEYEDTHKTAAALRVVLRRGGTSVWSTSVRTPKHHVLVRVPVTEPGDYVVEVLDNDALVTRKPVTVGFVRCTGEESRLRFAIGGEPYTAKRRYARPGESQNDLVLNRWELRDRDPAYLVEWIRDGKTLFESRGRARVMEAALSSIEHLRAGGPSLCAASASEEHYPIPTDTTRPWEVRVHREGHPSLALTLGENDMRPRTIDTPADAKAKLAQIPALHLCSEQYYRGLVPAGASPVSAEVLRHNPGCQPGSTGPRVPVSQNPFPATAAEIRAIIRSAEVLDLRVQLNAAAAPEKTSSPGQDLQFDRETAERLGPNGIWRARQAEQRVYESELAANKAAARQRAMPLAAKLQKIVTAHGAAPFTADERPIPGT